MNFTLADICAAYSLRIGVQAGLLPLEGRLERLPAPVHGAARGAGVPVFRSVLRL